MDDKKVTKLLKCNYANINIGFNRIIFSLYFFIRKLYDELKKFKYDQVFFLSREGEFLKELFDYYNKVNDGNIKSNYLKVSRKSTYLPSLRNIKEEDFSYLLNQYRNISIREFLGSLNFDDKDINSINKSLDIDIDAKIDNIIESDELSLLKKNKCFKDIYESKRIEQKDIFSKYIKQFTNKKNIAVVDIGWNGSIQDNIQNILGKEYELKGYYFGLVLRNDKYSKNKKGLIFSNYPNETDNFKLYYQNRTIYEIMLGASHGSAVKYYVDKNNKVEVELFEKKEELEIYNDIVKPSQNDMFKIFKKLCEIKDVNEKDINKIHYDLVFNPTKEQLKFFDELYHYENFGVFEFTTFNNKNRCSLYKWIKENAKFFLKNKTYFEDCFWPVLELYNNKMYIPYLIYKNKMKKDFKKKDLF